MQAKSTLNNKQKVNCVYLLAPVTVGERANDTVSFDFTLIIKDSKAIKICY